MIITTIIASLIAEMMFFYGAFAITKKFFRKRPTSYLLSGVAILVWFSISLFRKDVDKELSKIGIVISMILAAIVILAFYIGEKRALASGKHCGDFELDRGARKFAPYSIKKTFSKFKYPFLKEKGIFNNIEIVPANKMINTETVEYKAEVAQRKFTYHFIHWFFMFCWYMIVLGIWMWYFMGYGVYWMFAAAIDTFKDLYTKDGSKFSFKAAISEITNSEELTNGIKAVKNAAQTVSSKTGSAISEINQKAVSALAEHKKNKETSKENINTDVQNNISDNVIMSSRNDTPEIAGTTWSEISPLDSDNINDIDVKNEDSVTLGENNETNSEPVHDAPVQNFKQLKSISSPAPTLNVTPNQGYIIQKQKTSPVLIIVIIVLVLVIGVLGSMFFMMSRNDKSDNSAVSDVVETTAEVTETPTESENQTTTAETTENTTLDLTTETTETTSNNENSHFSNYNAPKNGDKIIEMNIRDYGTVKFRLFPEYADKSVENFIKLAESGYYDGLTFHRVIRDFMIQGGDPLGTGYGGESILGGYFDGGTDPHLIHVSGAVAFANSGSTATNGSQFYIVTGEQNITEDDFLNYEEHGYSFSNERKKLYIENGGTPWLDDNYTIFGQVFEGLDIIFEIQYCGTDSEYRPLNNIIIDSVKVTEYNGDKLKWHISDYDLSATETPDSLIKYTVEEIKNAAGSDFYFYDRPPYSYGKTVATESDSLNLRAAPSPDADIITQIPKGASVGEMGYNNDWSYISYTVNGETYVGYVSSQYLD